EWLRRRTVRRPAPEGQHRQGLRAVQEARGSRREGARGAHKGDREDGPRRLSPRDIGWTRRRATDCGEGCDYVDGDVPRVAAPRIVASDAPRTTMRWCRGVGADSR